MDEGYCYDGQFDSLEGWLCTISGQLGDIKELLKSNNNPIVETPLPGKDDVYCPPGEFKKELPPVNKVKIDGEA